MIRYVIKVLAIAEGDYATNDIEGYYDGSYQTVFAGEVIPSINLDKYSESVKKYKTEKTAKLGIRGLENNCQSDEFYLTYSIEEVETTK